MLNKIKRFKEPAINIYVVFITIYLVIREAIPLQFLINKTVVSVAVFSLGFLLILWDLFTDKKCLQGRPADFLVAFTLITVISSIVNYKYGIASNIKCIAAMVLEYFLFFPLGFKENKEKTLKLFLNTLIFSMMAFVAVSIPMYIFSLDYTVTIGDRVFVQGFNTEYNRLWGILCDPNLSSYVASVTIFASMYMMYIHKKVWAYIVHGLNILLQVVYIVLAISRSGMLVLITTPILACCYILISYIKKNKKKAILGIVSGICVSAALFLVAFGTQNLLPYLKREINSDISNQAKQNVINVYKNMYTTSGYLLTDNNPFVPSSKNENEKGIEKIERNDEKEDYSNGRFDRWNAGFEAFKTTPVIGTSPRNTVALSKDRTDVGKYELITHCSYLEILVDTGVVGAITMYSGLIYIVVKIIKASMKNKLNAECLATVACILSCALGALFISDIFFIFTINSFVFFYMLGYLYGAAEDNKSGIVYKIFTSIFKKRAAKEAQPSLKDSQDTHEC